LKRSGQFIHAKEHGERLSVGCLTANWLDSQGKNESTQVGIITSRKIGNAVVRNRARRLLREAFRAHQHELKDPLTLVLVARPSIVGKNFLSVQRDFLTAMRRAKLLKDTV
jgi:ribonuclease P protein component